VAGDAAENGRGRRGWDREWEVPAAPIRFRERGQTGDSHAGADGGGN
jgi:hypothetical protein